MLSDSFETFEGRTVTEMEHTRCRFCIDLCCGIRYKRYFQVNSLSTYVGLVVDFGMLENHRRTERMHSMVA